MATETDTDTDDAPAAFVRRWRGLPPDQGVALLVDLVRTEAAAVLGHEAEEPVEADSVFFDVGFVSLTAVELRDRLQAVTGLELPALLVFDQPTPAELGEYLAELLAASAASAASAESSAKSTTEVQAESSADATREEN